MKNTKNVIFFLLKNIILTVIAICIILVCFEIYSLFFPTTYFNMREGLVNKDEISTPWTKLPVHKQIQRLNEESNTIIEHILNTSQGNPEKLDYDKLLYVKKIKSSLDEIKNQNTDTNASTLSTYNPFNKTSDNSNEDNSDESEQSNNSEKSKFFW